MSVEQPAGQTDEPTFALQRRHVLMGVGAAGAAAVLAACSSSSSPSTTTSSPAASATDPAPGKSAAAMSAAGTELAKTSAVPAGGGLLIEDRQVVITQPKAGEYKAFSSICPHQGCTVNEFSATTITCPCHQSQFDSTTGDVTRGPATTGLTPVDIAVSGDTISTKA